MMLVTEPLSDGELEQDQVIVACKSLKYFLTDLTMLVNVRQTK